MTADPFKQDDMTKTKRYDTALNTPCTTAMRERLKALAKGSDMPVTGVTREAIRRGLEQLEAEFDRPQGPAK